MTITQNTLSADTIQKNFSQDAVPLKEGYEGVFILGETVVKLFGNGNSDEAGLVYEHNGSILAKAVGGDDCCYSPELMTEIEISHPIYETQTSALVYPYVYGDILSDLENPVTRFDPSLLTNNLYRALLINVIIGNWDCHGRNLIVGSDGQVTNIDLEANHTNTSFWGNLFQKNATKALAGVYKKCVPIYPVPVTPEPESRQEIAQDLADTLRDNKDMLTERGLGKYYETMLEHAKGLVAFATSPKHPIQPA